MHFYIGWDSTEDLAYQVCRHSIAHRCTGPDLTIRPIKHRPLRKASLFWREWRMDAMGQWWDTEDGKPFSTEFAFTRFLTPYLAKRDDVKDWAIFCDCDFLFLTDVKELEAELDDTKALMCVQHNARPLDGVKMDGQIQTNYHRKNWSSLMAFNLRHPANERLTPECVSGQEGSWLHGLRWLKDEDVGFLNPGWNRLVGLEQSGPDTARALHYTRGGPWIEGWKPQDHDWLWERERAMLLHPTTFTNEKLIGMPG